MKNILITGANGMFGQDAVMLFKDFGYEVIAATKSDLDVTNLASLQKIFSRQKIDLVIHAAAYTRVDEAENNRDLAFLINAEGAKNVALATKEKSIPLVYISTDYVFDGEKGSAYLTSDNPNPVNIYGASKLAGEENVRRINPQHYIVRTSWLYGRHGKNFVDTMIQISHRQKVIKVVSDQFGCPTWTYDLALGIKKLIEEKKSFGIYQVCGNGITSWYEFAKKIFEFCGVKIEVIPVSTTDFPRPAKRPKFSAMNNDGLCRNWEEALEEYCAIAFSKNINSACKLKIDS